MLHIGLFKLAITGAFVVGACILAAVVVWLVARLV